MRVLFFLAIIFIPTAAAAESACERFGLYAFHLGGCPQYELGVDTSIPLCQQETWKHLAFMDYRCYVPAPPAPSCYEWNCAVPYDEIFVEPISGRTMTRYGSAEDVDMHYRAARESLGQCVAASAAKLKRKKQR